GAGVHPLPGLGGDPALPGRAAIHLVRHEPRAAVRRDRHLGARLGHGRVPVPGLAARHRPREPDDRPEAQRLHGSARPMRSERIRGTVVVMGALLVGLYVFLYAPIFYVIYTSFAADIVWPFPPAFSVSSYDDLFASSLYGEALRNSFVLGIGSALLSTVLATGGAIGVRPHRARWRGPAPA